MPVTTKTSEEWDAYDTARMELAMREIEKSPNLRFFLRSQLVACGVTSTPHADTNDATNFLCGRHSVGTDIIATILTHNRSLYLALLEEDQNEQRDRDQSSRDY